MCSSYFFLHFLLLRRYFWAEFVDDCAVFLLPYVLNYVTLSAGSPQITSLPFEFSFHNFERPFSRFFSSCQPCYLIDI